MHCIELWGIFNGLAMVLKPCSLRFVPLCNRLSDSSRMLFHLHVQSFSFQSVLFYHAVGMFIYTKPIITGDALTYYTGGMNQQIVWFLRLCQALAQVWAWKYKGYEDFVPISFLFLGNWTLRTVLTRWIRCGRVWEKNLASVCFRFLFCGEMWQKILDWVFFMGMLYFWQIYFTNF